MLQARVQLPFWAAGLLPLMGPMLVDKALEYGGNVEAVKRNVLLPFFTATEQFGKRGRQMLEGLPPLTPKAA